MRFQQENAQKSVFGQGSAPDPAGEYLPVLLSGLSGLLPREGEGDTLSLIFWEYSIPIHMSSGALVKSVNNNITVTERVKAKIVDLHLRYIDAATVLTH